MQEDSQRGLWELKKHGSPMEEREKIHKETWDVCSKDKIEVQRENHRKDIKVLASKETTYILQENDKIGVDKMQKFKEWRERWIT